MLVNGGTELMPVCVICKGHPKNLDMNDFTEAPIVELIDSLQSDDHLFLVDYACNPGTCKLVQLAGSCPQCAKTTVEGRR